MNRRAFTLVEMIVVLGVLPIVMLVMSGVFATFVLDVPRAARVVEQDTTVQNMLRRLGRDIEHAKALPQTIGELEAGEDLLLIQQPDALIRYAFGDERIVRTRMAPPDADAGEDRIWTVPKATVGWRPWRRDGRTVGVAVDSHIRQTTRRGVRPVLRSTRVFFMQGLGKGREVQ